MRSCTCTFVAAVKWWMLFEALNQLSQLFRKKFRSFQNTTGLGKQGQETIIIVLYIYTLFANFIPKCTKLTLRKDFWKEIEDIRRIRSQCIVRMILKLIFQGKNIHTVALILVLILSECWSSHLYSLKLLKERFWEC